MNSYKNIDPLMILGINKQYNTNDRPLNDYYATPPEAVEWLLHYEHFNKNIWEPCCGEGSISETLKKQGYNVRSSDILDYGYKDSELLDFTEASEKFKGDIITNPPYNNLIPFVLKAWDLCENKFAMLFKIQFLETIQRHKKIFSKIPPSKVYIFTKRIKCFKGGKQDKNGSAICFCWIVWEKDNTHEPIIKWIPNYLNLF